jgi:ribonuclease M5
MRKIKETILVEGKYDRIRLSSVVEADVIACDGFSIFSDKGKMELIRALAKKNGLIVLADSDRAGFLIRNYVKSCVTEGVVKHAYIPDVPGKEKRKIRPSKEGTLGVEGMETEVLLQALERAGASIAEKEGNGRKIEAADLYEDGLCGRKNSREKRAALLAGIELPARLSTKELLTILNALYDFGGYKKIIGSLTEAL